VVVKQRIAQLIALFSYYAKRYAEVRTRLEIGLVHVAEGRSRGISLFLDG
jgi:hypothetical protein